MLGKVLLCLSTIHIYGAWAQRDCTDLRGTEISHGLHYVPGPDTCTLCICDNGQAKVCKAVLCSPPQNCRSFRVGNTCCDFICLDDVVKPSEGAAGGIRLAAGGAAGALLAAAALAVYRVRRHKRRRTPHTDDQRSLTSIGYISGGMAYMSGTCETALGGWKPGHYLPRGEAPPPYDEAMEQCRPDSVRLMTEPYHRTFAAPPEDCAHYGNITRAPQMLPPPACYQPQPPPHQSHQGLHQAPHQGAHQTPHQGLHQTPHQGVHQTPHQGVHQTPHQGVHQTPHQGVHQTPHLGHQDMRDQNAMAHHPLVPNVLAFPGVRLTGSLGAISRAAPAPHITPAHALHRTIPRISPALTPPTNHTNPPVPPEFRGARAVDVRRSFHRPPAVAPSPPAAGRSVPRLDLADGDRHDIAVDSAALLGLAAAARHRARSEERRAPDPAPNDLPLTVDKPSCECSYSGPGETGEAGEDGDDYRSECANCKAAAASRWSMSVAGVGPGSPPAGGWGSAGAVTLRARAPPAPSAPQTNTNTLPQPVTRPQRSMMGPPSNWENWFNTIPDSDTESEEE